MKMSIFKMYSNGGAYTRTLDLLLQPIYANETWSIAFMHDVLNNGVLFCSFNVIEDFNRECLNLTLDTSINSKRVIRELDKFIGWRAISLNTDTMG
jgi:putative transposase